jgi:hypothetical protein
MRWRLLLSAVVALAAGGCARRLPHGIAQRYLENLWQYDYRDCYLLLTDADRAARTLPEFLTEIPLAPDVSPLWFRPVLHQTQFVLGEATRDGDRASVPVNITTSDLPRWERMLDRTASPSGVTPEQVQRSLDRGDYPKRIYEDRIFLLKEHHHWRIVGGFTIRDPIVRRHREALNDYLADRYDKAIPRWQTMISELKAQRATGSWGLAEQYGRELARLEQLRASSPISQAYATRLTLKDVAMKMSEERKPAIFGSIRNAGNQPVDQVILAVTWYSGRGKALHAVYREEHQVVMTPVEFIDFSRPVLPFAPGESRPFGFVLTAPTDIQQEASPYVTISSVALAETLATPPSAARPTLSSVSPSAIPAAPRAVTISNSASH